MHTHDCGQNLLVLRIIWFIIFLATSVEIVFIVRLKLYPSYLAWDEHIILQNRGGDEEATHTGSESDPATRSPTPVGGVPASTGPSIPKKIVHSESWKTMLKWPVVSCSLLALTSAISIAIVALIRMIDPRLAIGVNLGVTFMYCIWAGSFVVAERSISFSWLTIRSKLVRFTEKDENEAKLAILRLKQYLYIGYLFDATRLVCIFLLHALPQYQNIFACYVHTAVVGTIIYSAHAFVRGGRALEQLLTAGIDSLPTAAKEEREHALTTIRNIISGFKRTVMMPSIIFILSGWWPFLRSHISYVQIQILATAIIMFIHLKGLNPPQLHRRRQPTTHDNSSHPHTPASTHTHTPASTQPSTPDITTRGVGGGGSISKDNKGYAKIANFSTPVLNPLIEKEEEEDPQKRNENKISMIELTETGMQHKEDSRLDASTAPLVFTHPTPDDSHRSSPMAEQDSRPASPDSSLHGFPLSSDPNRDQLSSSQHGEPIIFNPFHQTRNV